MIIDPNKDSCGAFVRDVQLRAITNSELDDLQSAFFEHGVLFFRDQKLSPREHLRFAKRFGPVTRNSFFTPLEGYPDIAVVSKSADQSMNIGGGWHTDHSYEAAPAMGSILVARELPRSGGDTYFANLSKVFKGLDPEMLTKVMGVRAVHSNDHIYGEGGYYDHTDQADNLGGRDAIGKAIHPIVIAHPETSAPILYVNPAHVTEIIGYSDHETKALLTSLYEHAAKDEFTYRFTWEEGSVAMWDNRSTWHMAMNDYQGEARLMHRITLKGSTLTAAEGYA